MPGGGGMGSPSDRDPEAVERDIRLGYISEEAARTEYGLKP
jgi:N-methylhydantoinase B